MFNLRPHADRKRSNRSGLLFATFLASTALTATAGYAQTATWIDNSALTWDTPSGWDTNAEPDANTDVIIPPADQTNGGVSIRVNTPDAVARSIQINGGLNVWDGRLVVGQDITATGPNALMGVHGTDINGDAAQMIVNGQLNFDVGGNFSVYDGGILTTHGAVLSGNGDINNINWFASSINNGGLFDNSGYEMTLGRAGHAYLHLYSGGELVTQRLNIGLEAATAGVMAGEGLLQIDSGSLVTVTQVLEVGGAGEGEVRVNAGSQLDTTVAWLGDEASGVGLVTVDGGTWHNSGALTLGANGRGTMNVLNGGAFDALSVNLGQNASATGTVVVAGPASSLDTTDSSFIGYRGQGHLHILDGAAVSIGTNTGNDFAVGYYEDAEGTVLVQSGGTLTGTGALRIGSEGAGVVIVDGAGSLASFNELTAGGSAGGNGQIVLGNGAEMAITQFATIGYAGTASLSLTGGSLFTAAADMGIATADIASTGDVLVNDSRIEVAGQFDLGTYGTATMRLENRGELRTGSFYAANAAGSAADFMLTGFSTSWENTGDAHIGTGDGARLSLLDQASAYVGGNLFIGNAAGTGESGVAIANGIVSVQGDLTQYANSIYSYVIGDGAMAGGGIMVNGTATIEQGARLGFAIDGNVAMGDQFIVLNAIGGVNGTYVLNGGQVSAFLTVDALYDPTSVTLVVTNISDFADVAATPNQIATAGGLQSLGGGNALYDTILNIATEDEARFAFDQLSGEVHASLKTALIEDSRFVRNAANDRIRAAFGDATVTATPVLAYGPGGPELAAPDTDLLTVWGQGFGSWGDWDSDGNAASFSRNTGGFLTGADAFVSDWRLGLMAGYSHTSLSADDRASSGSVDSYHLGLYGGTQWGALTFRSGLAYAWHDIDTRRNVAFPGFAEAISGSYDAATLHGFGELAYQFDVTPRTVLEPFANLAFVSHRTDAYSGAGGTAALSAAAQTIDTTFTTLGLRASHGFTLNAVEMTARGMVGWRHAFGDTTPTSTHAFAGGDAFTVAGVPIGKNAALVEAGLDFALSPAATLGFTYAGRFASGSTDQAIKANLNVKF